MTNEQLKLWIKRLIKIHSIDATVEEVWGNYAKLKNDDYYNVTAAFNSSGHSIE